MLRFLADGALEAWLRPLLMMDPLAGIYFEVSAPDWRFAALMLAVLAVCLRWLRSGRPKPALTAAQWRGLVGLVLVFATWTVIVGNGRYFVTGLLWVGPLVVLAWRGLPGTMALRATLLALLLAVQLHVVAKAWEPNTWGLVRWGDGPALQLAPSPLREQPAVFLTLSSISYTALVPLFHPQSRWANVAGQTLLLPTMREYPAFERLLDSGLPLYLISTLHAGNLDDRGYLQGDRADAVAVRLRPHGLAVATAPCHVLRSTLAVKSVVLGSGSERLGAFVICPLVRTPPEPIQRNAGSVQAAAAMDAVERRCPRFFPVGTGAALWHRDVLTRQYPASDALLQVDATGHVVLQYFRAFNPTFLGMANDVAAGRFTMPCDKLPGRYQLPWRRD